METIMGKMSSFAALWLVVSALLAFWGLAAEAPIFSVLGGLGLLDVLPDGQPLNWLFRPPPEEPPQDPK